MANSPQALRLGPRPSQAAGRPTAQNPEGGHWHFWDDDWETWETTSTVSLDSWQDVVSLYREEVNEPSRLELYSPPETGVDPGAPDVLAVEADPGAVEAENSAVEADPRAVEAEILAVDADISPVQADPGPPEFQGVGSARDDLCYPAGYSRPPLPLPRASRWWELPR